MRPFAPLALSALLLTACGGGPATDDDAAAEANTDAAIAPAGADDAGAGPAEPECAGGWHDQQQRDRQ